MCKQKHTRLEYEISKRLLEKKKFWFDKCTWKGYQKQNAFRRFCNNLKLVQFLRNVNWNLSSTVVVVRVRSWTQKNDFSLFFIFSFCAFDE